MSWGHGGQVVFPALVLRPFMMYVLPPANLMMYHSICWLCYKWVAWAEEDICTVEIYSFKLEHIRANCYHLYCAMATNYKPKNIFNERNITFTRDHIRSKRLCGSYIHVNVTLVVSCTFMWNPQTRNLGYIIFLNLNFSPHLYIFFSTFRMVTYSNSTSFPKCQIHFERTTLRSGVPVNDRVNPSP